MIAASACSAKIALPRSSCPAIVKGRMKRMRAMMASGGCGLLALLAWAATPSPAGHWKLIWADEFNSRRLDLGKWTVADTAGRALYGGEWNFYNPDDVAVRDGKLVLQTRNFPE